MPAIAVPSIPLDELQRLLRVDAPYLFISFALISIAFAVIALLLIRRDRDPLLLSFATFAFLYGLRLWMQRHNAHIIFHDSRVFARISDSIDYLVPLPAMVFFYLGGFLSRTGKRLALLLTVIDGVLFVLSLSLGAREIFHRINNVAVIVALLQFSYGLGWSHSPEDDDTRVVRFGLLAFIALALFDNFAGLMKANLYPVESAGFLLFIACLGYVAAQRMFARERRLLSIERELEIARRIQMSILPGEFPATSRLKVAVRYVPMTSVAGDFYDFVIAEDERAAILVADVSGHGVPAALIASMVKLAASSQREHAPHPARLLRGMNSVLVGNTQAQFVTAACVFFDTAAKELRYAAAAHPPMLRLRDGHVEEIEENGLMLAAFDFAAYEQRSVAIESGDRFLLYTDGVIEAANGSGEFFGEKRLKQKLQQCAGLLADEAADAITSTVRAWSPRQDDDITVLVCDIV
jgi:sigma-B regulation protein RsbU (phosphoserine phosphatase)